MCQAPNASSTNAIVESTAGAKRGSEPLYVAYRSRMYRRCLSGNNSLAKSRSDFQGAITFKSPIRVGRLMSENTDLSSDSTNGSRETSHIRSARLMSASHCAATSEPRTRVISS